MGGDQQDGADHLGALHGPIIIHEHIQNHESFMIFM